MKIFRSLCISLLAINSSLSFYSNNSKRFVSSLGAMALFSNYQGIRGDGNGGQGMILLPKDGIYENVIIFMHGIILFIIIITVSSQTYYHNPP